MHHALISLRRSALRISPVALAGLTVLAACDTDRPLEPTQARVPAAAQPAVILRSPHLVSGFVDLKSNFIGGGSFTVKDSLGTPIIVVADNGQYDIDKLDGKFRIVLPTEGKYTLCGTQPPPGYMFGIPAALCFPVVAKNSQITQVLPLLVVPKPAAFWYVTDGNVFKGLPVLLAGASFNVSIPREFVSIDVVDNGLNDLDPRPGITWAKLPKAGVYTLCETKPPAGHWNANPACRTLNVAADVPANGGTSTTTRRRCRVSDASIVAGIASKARSLSKPAAPSELRGRGRLFRATLSKAPPPPKLAHRKRIRQVRIPWNSCESDSFLSRRRFEPARQQCLSRRSG